MEQVGFFNDARSVIRFQKKEKAQFWRVAVSMWNEVATDSWQDVLFKFIMLRKWLISSH